MFPLFQTKLWIFPEGTRFNKGSIQPFKKGAFYLAIDSQIPIMPVVFSQYYFLDNESKTFEPGMVQLYAPVHSISVTYFSRNDKFFLFSSGKVVITTLPPISTKGMTRNDLETLSDMTRQQMIEVFNESSKNLVMQRKIAF